MLNLLTIPGHHLPPKFKCQIDSFMRIHAWQVFYAKPIGWDFIDYDTHPVSFILAEEDTLISHALVTWRFLSHANQQFKVYGLSAVLTYPQFRHHGYGRQVVTAASHYIANSDADIALLRCKPDLYGFYQSTGWTYSDKLLVREGEPGSIVEGGRIMSLIVSEKGQKHLVAFENEPLYVGAYMW
jgi:GNAT superfamily N-acetyltransferase